MNRKGIILAGGSATRLYPLTNVISKHLLAVFDKPMIYYSITTLMLADVREILLISSPRDIELFKKLLGDGSKWGINLSYAIQESPDGLAQSLLIAKNFLNGSPSVLILGDNFFYGDGLQKKLLDANIRKNGATIFGYRVNDPERYGIIEVNDKGKVKELIEKPINPSSNLAITGIYFYDSNAPIFAEEITPSERGELEITDLNNIYLDRNELYVEKLGRGYAWLDLGTHESLLEANQFVQTIEHRQGRKIACPEEIAFRKKWITKDSMSDQAKSMLKNSYGKYLLQIMNEIEYENN